jgi:hypothetical protein
MKSNQCNIIETRYWKCRLTHVLAVAACFIAAVTWDGRVNAASVHNSLLSSELHPVSHPSRNLRQTRSDKGIINPQRLLQVHLPKVEYYRTDDTAVLGAPNYMAAIGNPLKGLVGFGPREFLQQSLPDNVPSAIEKYNLGLNEIMIGDNQFNWTSYDRLVEASASRKMHAVFSIFIHWPGEPLRLPSHLLDLPLVDTQYGKSPNYGDLRLLLTLQQFIIAWGQHTDGDTRIAAIHVGLLGFWGEGHTFPDTTLVPESSTQLVAEWYRIAFTKTQVQTRYPGPNADGFGLFDASLAYSTLDGAANGGVDVGWFMYPQIVSKNQQNNWKQSMMGGETRPELQSSIFTKWYPKATEHKQDLRACIDALHISYVVHQDAFIYGGYTGDVLYEANQIHAYMGYSFYVSEVATSALPTKNPNVVDVSISITQQGAAPFYYDLHLVLECSNGTIKSSLPGVNDIVEQGSSKIFTFANVPATNDCLDNVTLSLSSSYAYPGRPIRFGQGTDGAVAIRIPQPTAITSNETNIGSFFSLIFSPLRNFFKDLLAMLF